MASIPEKLINQVFTVLTAADAAIVTAIGRRATETYDGAHRVVAIPTGAPEITEPDRPGDGLYTDAGRILLLRRFAVEWQCHDIPSVATTIDAPDFTNSEALYLLTVAAIRGLFHHSVHFSNERWIDQEENQDGVDRSGTVIAFTTIFDIPVYDVRLHLGPLTGTPQITTTVELGADVGDEVTINQ